MSSELSILGEFRDPAQEEAYQGYVFEQHQRAQGRVMYAIVLATGLLLPLLDYLVVPDLLLTALVLRIGLVVPVAIAALVVSTTRHFRRFFMATVLGPMLVGWGVFFRLAGLAAQPGSYLYLTWPLVFTLAAVPVFRLTARRAALLTSAVLVEYLVAEVFALHSSRTVFAFLVTAYSSCAIFGPLLAHIGDATLRKLYLQSNELEAERARSDTLLLNILPESIAARLKGSPEAIAEGHDDASVLFADIVGFTPLSQRLSARELVDLLNELFSRFDELSERHRLEKIKTIGDAYMVAGGVPFHREDHVGDVVQMALDMHHATAEFAKQRGVALGLRIGIHVGPVVAGVIGKRKFSYDLWGDTVNTAARMESHGIPGAIQVTEVIRDRLGDRFAFEPRGEIDVKGKGLMRTWLLRA